MKIISFSGIGMRKRQEDSYAVEELLNGANTLLVASDGMGGHGYGDEASRTVVKGIVDYWKDNELYADCNEKIDEAVKYAANVYEQNADGREMGATLVMASIVGNQVYMAHCGDSRIYVWHRDTGQHFHTFDHTLKAPQGWDLITNAFFTGMCDLIKPEIRCELMSPGDRMMLCSDGVFKCLKDEQFWILFTSLQPLEDMASDLEAYCYAIASDNFTAIIVQF